MEHKHESHLGEHIHCECGCCEHDHHDHHHEHEEHCHEGHCDCGHDEESSPLKKILLAGVIFIAALLFEHLPIFSAESPLMQSLSANFRSVGFANSGDSTRLIYGILYLAAYLLCGRDVIKGAIRNIHKEVGAEIGIGDIPAASIRQDLFDMLSTMKNGHAQPPVVMVGIPAPMCKH